MVYLVLFYEIVLACSLVVWEQFLALTRSMTMRENETNPYFKNPMTHQKVNLWEALNLNKLKQLVDCLQNSRNDRRTKGFEDQLQEGGTRVWSETYS